MVYCADGMSILLLSMYTDCPDYERGLVGDDTFPLEAC
jgi:hypothetical protein